MAILKVKMPSGKVIEFTDLPVDSMTVETFKDAVSMEAASTEELPPSFQLWHNSDYLHEGKSLKEAGVLADSVLRVKLPKYADPKKRGLKRFATGESKKTKYSVIKEAVDGVATNQAALLTGQANMQADVTAIRAAVSVMSGQPPVNIPGELELMELILDKLKVAHMNSLLVRWRITRPPGIKKNGKARLLAQKAPLSELQEVLRDPAASGMGAQRPAPLQSLGLNTQDTDEFERRLAAQVAQPARGPLESMDSMHAFAQDSKAKAAQQRPCTAGCDVNFTHREKEERNPLARLPVSSSSYPVL